MGLNRPKKRRFNPLSMQLHYIPPLSANRCLADYYVYRIEATKLKPRKTRNNLSHHQQIALGKGSDIYSIKKVGKGSTVVI